MRARFVHESVGGRVVFGAGTLPEVRGEAVALGMGRILLITSASSATTGDEAESHLGDLTTLRWREVVEHVPVALAERARAAAGEVGADGIVSVGGGSATGLAKAVALDLKIPVLAVPTTYSGSEMTQIWGMTDGEKVTGRDPCVKPSTVIYDPEVTVDLAPAVTAQSAFNALAHCVEALYAKASNPLTDLVCEGGIRALSRALPDCIGHPRDIEARANLMFGAWMAGLAMAEVGMGLHHRICHILGGRFAVRHGAANAALLPHVVAFNTEVCGAVLDPLRRALGSADPALALWDLARDAGLEPGLASLGVQRRDLEAVARQVVESSPDNPRALVHDEVLAMLDEAWSGCAPGSPVARRGTFPEGGS